MRSLSTVSWNACCNLYVPGFTRPWERSNMTSTYQEFLKHHISLAPLGIYQDDTGCRSKPEGARIFGRAGTDGTRYCFIPGYDEMVFAVSPLNSRDSLVHPLAENFHDFLRLLLACKNADALAQAWKWEHSQFEAYIKKTVPDRTQQEALSLLARLGIHPMENPFRYLKTLESGFDYGRLCFTDDGVLPEDHDRKKPGEWKVFFHGSFYGKLRGHYPGERAGKEIVVDKTFLWGNEEWTIPSVYTCSSGLIIDFLLKVRTDDILAFIRKWQPGPGSGTDDPDQNSWRQMEEENPLTVHFTPSVYVNGNRLSCDHSAGICWNPVCPGDITEIRPVMNHYRLNPACGRVIWRSYFPWTTKRRPDIRTLAVDLKSEKQTAGELRFHTAGAGNQILFTHPVTGQKHTLSVKTYSMYHMDGSLRPDPAKIWPDCYMVMGYTITPALAADSFTIMDCAACDKPKEIPDKTAASISIIGGADGPSCIFFRDPDHPQLQYAASALHFKPVKEVEWQMIFYQRKKADIRVEIFAQGSASRTKKTDTGNL